MARPVFRLAGLLAAGVIGLVASNVAAQSAAAETAPRREAEAMEFARRHHPELAELLKRLKSGDEKAYEKAVRDVAQTSERLTRLRENDAERYESAVKVWTLDSRIRLLAARSTMSDDPSIAERLRELLRERRDARLAMLRLDRRRTSARLEKLDEQIDLLESRGDETIETDLARLRRAIDRSPNRRGTAGTKDVGSPSKPESDRNGKSGTQNGKSAKAATKKTATPKKAAERNTPSESDDSRSSERKTDDTDTRRDE